VLLESRASGSLDPRLCYPGDLGGPFPGEPFQPVRSLPGILNPVQAWVAIARKTPRQKKREGALPWTFLALWARSPPGLTLGPRARIREIETHRAGRWTTNGASVRILIVEDELRVRSFLKRGFTEVGMAVDTANDGNVALAAATATSYDIIILDLTLPGLDGLEVLRKLRAEKSAAPVLILTARDSVDDRVRGLDAGADDYLIKPFDNRELLARIEAVRRRFRGHDDSVVRTGDLTLNFDTQLVEIGGKRVYVTPKEYSILELLCQRQGVVLSKEAFLDHLYAGRDEPETKIIDVFVCKLRKKLTEASGGKTYIETVWGRGYVLRDPAPVEDAAPEPQQVAASG